MKIVVAPNAFKDSLSASEAVEAMARGIRAAVPGAEIVRVPVADGGDGLAEILTEAMGGELLNLKVSGPRRKEVLSRFGFLRDQGIGIVELAEASGLALLSNEERDPTLTTTCGTGQLMVEAVRLGAKRLIVGLGGSATSDGGSGMAAALGFRFFDAGGELVSPQGGNLSTIARIDATQVLPELRDVSVEVICDVQNPLTGPRGAARVYAPQKGASPEQVEQLEHGLEHLANLIERDLGVDVRELPGGGAAGGIGAGLFAFCGATLRPGVEVVLDIVGMEQKLNGADLVLTAEGRLDDQTRYGKAPAGVARLAQKVGVPCVAIAGGVEYYPALLEETGLTAAFPLCDGPRTLEDSIANAAPLLERATEQVVRLFASGR